MFKPGMEPNTTSYACTHNNNHKDVTYTVHQTVCVVSIMLLFTAILNYHPQILKSNQAHTVKMSWVIYATLLSKRYIQMWLVSWIEKIGVSDNARKNAFQRTTYRPDDNRQEGTLGFFLLGITEL